MVAATRGPGLIGALLVGFSYAKALAAARELPFVPVDHLRGHVLASTLGDEPIEPPFVCLVASGGHTFVARVDDPADGYSILGETLDDAAGEAFDKGARLLGLGYPGGPALDRLADGGDPAAFEFPRSGPGELDFSFSGLKTALLYKVRDLGEEATAAAAADLAASYQAAIVEALTTRLAQAVDREGVARVALGGGVAANSGLRRRSQEVCDELGVRLWVPPISLCTDNAAMIAGGGPVLRPDRVPGLPRARRRRTPVTVLTFYGKPGCHLCGPAREEVATVAEELGCEARRGRHHHRSGAVPPLRRADSGGRRGRRGTARTARRRGRLAQGAR